MNGDKALRKFTAEFDKADIEKPEVSEQEKYFALNQVDTNVFDHSHECELCVEVQKKYGRDFVLSVARIETVKCQIALSKAMIGLPWNLVLVGKPGPNSLAYFKKLQQIAENSSNIKIVGQIDPKLLPCYYRSAKVHALVSWRETPGLSSLEAAAMGCNLVITKMGDTQEYFHDHAEYCDPSSVDSIREAILKAHQKTKNYSTAIKFAERYNWDAAASATLQGYARIKKITNNLE